MASSAPTSAPSTVARRPWPVALLRACRPKQWAKNVLVFAVPAASGDLGEAGVAAATGAAFVAFCLASSATYLLNDAADVEADRLHPKKRLRPIAAGELSLRAAYAAAALALVAAFGIALAVSLGLLGVVAGYVALTAAYTRWLKHVAIFDIAAVAAGFFLRAVAGGVGSDLYMSRWFLIVAGGGSLFLVTGKRYAELRAGGADAARRRAALAEYSEDYLRAMLSTVAGVTVLAYCQWAFEGSPAEEPSEWSGLSAVPFVLGVMRYGLLVDQGHGEEPEEVVFGDRVLQGIGVAWLGLLAAGVML
jgi:decaprenyl-phosphate phosphoribosyltransferase